jgi:amino acid transporter
LTAVYISSMQGASRIVFALARHRLLPKSLARLAGKKGVPRNAILGLLAAVIVLDLGTLYLLKNGLDSFTWWANALVFFATLTFLAVNMANIFMFWRSARGRFWFVNHVALPVLGILLNAYLIYAAFFLTLWTGDLRTGKSVVMVCVALLAVQIGALIFVRFAKPHLLTQGAPIGVKSHSLSQSPLVGALQPTSPAS